MVASRFGMSRSTAEAIDGNPNSIVAEIRDGVVNADGASGMTGGFSPADTVSANEAAQSNTKQLEIACSTIARWEIPMFLLPANPV